MIILTDGGALQLDLDVVTRIQHDGTSVVTDYTVETGVNVADHSRPEPDRVVLEGVVTDTPLDAPAFGFAGIDRVNDGGFLVWNGEIRRRRDVQAELTRIRVAGELVTVLTPSREYSNMAIEMCQFVQESETSGRTDVTLEFRQVRTASLQFVALPDPVERRGQKKGKRGKQSVKETEPTSSEASENESALSSILGL